MSSKKFESSEKKGHIDFAKTYLKFFSQLNTLDRPKCQKKIRECYRRIICVLFVKIIMGH